MSLMILQSIVLMFAAFMVSAGFGWLLAGRAMSEHSAFEKRPRAVFFDTPEAGPEVAMAAAPANAAVTEAQPEPEPVSVSVSVSAVSEAPVAVMVPEDMPEDVAVVEAVPEAAVAETPEAPEAPEETPEATQTDDMDQVVKQFTSGVIVPFKMPDNGHSAYAPPVVTPKLDMVAAAPVPVSLPVSPTESLPVSNVVIERTDTSLQRRVSSLAGMTPESIEAAVQQVGSGLEPLRLEAPQGKPDDLTVISGVADSNQRELNALGIYHYWQIAGWSPEHVAWISNRILFPRRVVRENWMAQAARLAKLT